MKHNMKDFNDTKLSSETTQALIEKVRTANNLLSLLRVVGPHCDQMFCRNQSDVDDFGRGVGAVANCACDLLSSVEDELFELQRSSD